MFVNGTLELYFCSYKKMPKIDFIVIVYKRLIGFVNCSHF